MTKKGQRIHITPNSQGQGWKVVPEKGNPITTTRTQAEALNVTRELLQNRPGGGEAIIHGRDNRIREGRTINRTDPFPPEG